MKSPLAVVQVAALVAAACSSLAAAPASAAPRAPSSPGSAAAAADTFMARRTPSLLATGTDTFTRDEVRKGTNGLQYFPYSRRHAGLAVVGGDVVVATDARHRVVGTSMTQDEQITVPTTPTVTAATATAAARRRVDHVTATTAPRLVITAVDSTHLAWETLVTGTDNRKPTKLHVFTDARTGSPVGEYDDVTAGTGTGYYSGAGTTFGTTVSAGTHTMVDPTHPGVSCSDQSAQPFTGPDDVWGDGTGTSLETACVDVMHAVDKQWQMLGAWLGRNGIDGRGHGFPARVGLDEANAYWNNDWANFGRSRDGTRQATSLDIVGHEYGHGVYGSTGIGGSGALNEGTADIFGTLTEAYANDPSDTPDYLIGELADLSGPGPIRSMFDPASLGGAGCWTAAVDTMETHKGAGVLNHWFYLLAEGSAPTGQPASPICTGGPTSITGMGQLPAAKVFYNALQMKSYSWAYADARITTLQAALNLYPGSCTEYTKVKNAWNAVAVPEQPGEPSCPAGAGTFDVSLPVPTARTVAGKSAWFSLDSALVSGAGQQITWSATGLPTGATVDFAPARVMAGGTSGAELTLPKTVPGGSYSIVFKGVCGGETHSVTGTLSVIAWSSGDFAVSAPITTMSIRAGQSGALALHTRITTGVPGSLYLKMDPRTLPTGVTVTFEPTLLAAGDGSTVTVGTSLDTRPGTYPLVITAGGSFSEHTVTVSYTVVAPNRMRFDVAPAVTIPAGSSQAMPITSTVVSGTAETVEWGVNPEMLPAGVTAVFNPPSGPAGTSTTLTLTLARSTTPGDHTIGILAFAPTMVEARTTTLTVTAPTGFCSGYASSVNGTLTSGRSQYQPSFTAAAGTHQVCLEGPTGTDFDVYLQQRNGSTWRNVSVGTTSATDERLTWTGPAGTYRYRVVAYSGSGNYTLAYTRP